MRSRALWGPGFLVSSSPQPLQGQALVSHGMDYCSRSPLASHLCCPAGMGHPRTEHTPRVPAVSLHLSIASKKPNEMQVCGSDSRDKLNFAVNNIFKRNSFASIFTLLSLISCHIAMDENHQPVHRIGGFLLKCLEDWSLPVGVRS